MPDSLRRALAGLLTAGLAAIIVVGIVAGEPRAEDRVESIGGRIKCPVCQGEAIAESPAETAQAMMQVVAEKVDEGLSDGQIYEFFRARYGDGILLDPPFGGRTLLLWLLPFVAVGTGVVMILGRRQAPTESAESRPSEDAP